MNSPASLPKLDVALGIIRRDRRILICQRLADGPLGGLWEFPGGKRELGETIEQCLLREIREELAITVTPIRRLGVIDHTYPHARVRLHPFLCRHGAGEPAPIHCQQIRWALPQELSHYRFPPANDALLKEVIAAPEVLSASDQARAVESSRASSPHDPPPVSRSPAG